ncbi:hypothetical protein [Streptomyces sp. NPDC091217]|uniref:hypothetical protein n=1 Tax=Streptomyces sp. NPDC091217 TaxID=3365975 RepID=UPI0038142368
MIETQSPTTNYDRTAVDDLSFTADKQGAVPAPYGHDCLAAVPPHLSLLRDSLACGTRRRRHAHPDGRAEHSHVPPRRRRPTRTTLAGRLTLAQWISRTSNIR